MKHPTREEAYAALQDAITAHEFGYTEYTDAGPSIGDMDSEFFQMTTHEVRGESGPDGWRRVSFDYHPRMNKPCKGLEAIEVAVKEMQDGIALVNHLRSADLHYYEQAR